MYCAKLLANSAMCAKLCLQRDGRPFFAHSQTCCFCQHKFANISLLCEERLLVPRVWKTEIYNEFGILTVIDINGCMQDNTVVP